MNTIIQPLLQRFHVQHFTAFRNILLGAGICYAIEQDKYWHIPFAFIFPSVYAGYQGYKCRDAVRSFIINKN
jgi:hypothetical protein